MNDPAISDPCWSRPPILASGERLAGVRDTRPTDADKGVLDEKTFDAIEIDQLFDSCNYACRTIGTLPVAGAASGRYRVRSKKAGRLA